MKRYTLHELLHLTFTGEERLCLASEVDAKIEELASCGVECSEGFKRMQARIAELEHELDIRKAAVEAQFRLMERVKELEKALRFYSDARQWAGKDHYSSPSQDFPAWTDRSAAEKDRGDIARKALGVKPHVL